MATVVGVPNWSTEAARMLMWPLGNPGWWQNWKGKGRRMLVSQAQGVMNTAGCSVVCR